MKKYLLAIVIIFLCFGTFTQVFAAEENKPLLRFQKTLDNIFKNSDNEKAKASSSLKEVDKALKATESFYKKTANKSNQNDLNIENLIAQSKIKGKIAELKLKAYENQEKEFKKAQKGLSGETNKLENSNEDFVRSFDDYKTTVISVILEVKKFTLQSSPTPVPTLTSENTPKPTKTPRPSGQNQGDDD